jgi:hypothetical protein
MISGKDTDPVATILRTAMGEWGFRAVLVVVLVSFMSCLISCRRPRAGCCLPTRAIR